MPVGPGRLNQNANGMTKDRIPHVSIRRDGSPRTAKDRPGRSLVGRVLSAPVRTVLFGMARMFAAPSRAISGHALAAVAAALCASLSLTSCGGSPRSGASGSEAVAQSGQAGVPADVHAPKLNIPQPPMMLTDDSLRLDFLATHYWDNLDWSDTRWIADTAALEGTFTPWAQLLALLPEAEAIPLTGGLISRGDSFPQMQLRLLDVAEYFWHHPNSPFRNEDLFIPVLEAIVDAPDIDSLYKLRPRAQLTSALKNRPGMRAADLAYTLSSGATGRLSDIRAEYTLLMFYNPGCAECARVEEYILHSEVFGPLTASGRMKVLAIYPDEDAAAWREHLPRMPQGWTVGHAPMERGGTAAYDLPGIPALYLLDRNKKVLAKDRPAEAIEAQLAGRE